jgi:hypothetical protein
MKGLEVLFISEEPPNKGKYYIPHITSDPILGWYCFRSYPISILFNTNSHMGIVYLGCDLYTGPTLVASWGLDRY